MKIVVIGRSGQLAKALSILNGSPHEIVCLSRDEINLFELSSLKEKLKSFNANGIINASAYTAVDKAQTDESAAYALNVTAVENLAITCHDLNIQLVHISTDYVFNGQSNMPYDPETMHSPLGVYGETKAEGENVLLSRCKNSAVIRTSWVYSSYGQNFVKTMLSLMQKLPKIEVISDQIGSPTCATGLARVCVSVLVNKVTGVHHYTDTGVASWFDFAKAIQRKGLDYGILQEKIPILPISSEEYYTKYPTLAPRPFYSVLNKSSLMKALPELDWEHWQDRLNHVVIKLAESEKIHILK